jgi:DNA-binding transcriptional regulator YhcF (GntR family)
MTTPGGPALPKYLRVAAVIRRQIADGTLRPGQPAPSGAELSRAFGFSTLTCRKALRALIAEGLLVPGPSNNARPRVADPQAPDIERDLADAARALSAGLAARRHAAGLTQAELAALAGVSVTTVGHAETGRTWQSRRFWERADSALRAAGDLLRLHDFYRAASSPRQGQRSTTNSIERTVSPTRPAHAPATLPAPPAHPFPVTPAHANAARTASVHTASAQTGSAQTRSAQPAHVQTGSAQTGSAQPAHVQPGSAQPAHLQPGSAQPAHLQPGSAQPAHLQPGSAQPAHLQPGSAQVGLPEVGLLQPRSSRAGAAEAGTAQGGPNRAAPSPVGPSRIVIVWTDGTITTVHAPEVLAGQPEPPFPDPER